MYLSQVLIAKLRSFGENGIRIDLNKCANVIVGENNSGKIALIDALRLMLNLGQGRREIYFTKDDFHVNTEGIKSKEAEIKMILKLEYRVEKMKISADTFEFFINTRRSEGGLL